MSTEITTGSHFSGYGSYLFALDLLGIPYKSLFACEIDKYARKTYEANHSTGSFYNDVTDPEILKAPYVDLFISSPPCQSFSNAGRRAGVNETRGTLFHYSKEYIKLKRPRFFIIENVPGLLSMDKGAVFKSWIDSLGDEVNGGGKQRDIFNQKQESAGYFIRWFKANSKEVGYPEPVPQNRDRVFIIGFRDKEDYLKYRTPEKQDLRYFVPDILEEEYPESLLLTERTSKRILNRLKDKSLPSPKITPSIAGTLCAGHYQKNSTDANYILIPGSPDRLRKFTPYECCILMGLPGSFKQPNSNNQAYKQYGNSIVVNTLSAIIKNLPL